MRVWGIIVAALLVVWQVWSWENSATLRYRVTVEVRTPEGVRTGSAVREHRASHGFLCGGLSYSPCRGMQGEAVVVDLGARGPIFALLTGGRHGVDWFPYNLFLRHSFYPRDTDLIVAYKLLNAKRPRVTLSADELPTFARFGDLKNPATAEVIDFVVRSDADLSIERATIEIVDPGWWPANRFGLSGTPITRGIEQLLPWVKSLPGYLSGRFVCAPSEPHCLEVGHLRR